MKTKAILTAVAAAAGVAYLVSRRISSSKSNTEPARSNNRPEHHLTDVFARAKENAVK